MAELAFTWSYLYQMDFYDLKVSRELLAWQNQMMKKPSWVNRLSKKWQNKLNSFIPEKAHAIITTTIKQMFRVVLFGSELTTSKTQAEGNFQLREAVILEKIKAYKKTAAVEGGITGAGGILLGLADFPLFLAIKIKLLFEIGATYGFDMSDYKERVYLLSIFQLAYSSQEKRTEVYMRIKDWKTYSANLPDDIHQFDWRTFQQEYRDYIDIVKMAQLIPIIGAPVGIIANYTLVTKLGKMAMNAYRMRLKEMELLVNG